MHLVQNVSPVGGGEHDDALLGGDAVHLDQQLEKKFRRAHELATYCAELGLPYSLD